MPPRKWNQTLRLGAREFYGDASGPTGRKWKPGLSRPTRPMFGVPPTSELYYSRSPVPRPRLCIARMHCTVSILWLHIVMSQLNPPRSDRGNTFFDTPGIVRFNRKCGMWEIQNSVHRFNGLCIIKVWTKCGTGITACKYWDTRYSIDTLLLRYNYSKQGCSINTDYANMFTAQR